jgi:TonB family protein
MRLRPASSSRFVVLAVAVAAQAVLAQDTQPAPAGGALADDEILVVDEEDLPLVWRHAGKGVPQLSPNPARRGADRIETACVAVGFVIESDGRVRTAKVLRSHPAGVLDAEGTRVARSMRFRPGPDNPARAPVYSVVAWSYGRGTERTVAEAIAPCQVDIEVPR